MLGGNDGWAWPRSLFAGAVILPGTGRMVPSAIVSTIGMILPGISGSVMLSWGGLLHYSWKPYPPLIFSIPVPVEPELLGGFFGVKIVGALIKDHPQALYMGILGLMIGSVALLYPYFKPPWKELWPSGSWFWSPGQLALLKVW